jgi:glutaredoxin
VSWWYNGEGFIPSFFSIINYYKSQCLMNFTIYSKEDCPYCYKVKQVLELTGNSFVVYNLGEHFTKEEFYAEFGEGSTFPQVVCDDQKLGGSVDTIKFLKEQQIIKS